MVDILCTNKITRTLRTGFSLAEILIVIVIIGIIGSIALSVGSNVLKRAKKTSAKAMLRTLQAGIDTYYNDTNVYPESLRDLIKSPVDEKIQKSWDGPYLKSKTVPNDPWGNKYVYQVTPDSDENPYELYTYLDGKKKGAVLSVWDEK